MKEKSDTFSILSAVLAGAGCGVLMAAVLLRLTQITGYEVNSLSFWFIAAAACAMPLCLDTLRYRGISPAVAEIVMIVVSAAVCFGYESIAAVNPAAKSAMTAAYAVMHGLSLLVYAAQFFISRLCNRERRDR